MHGAHHVGVRIERAACQAHIERVLIVVAFHEVAPPADDSHRKSAAETLAVGHEVGVHTEVLLRAPASEPKADKYLIEDEHDAPLGAQRRSFLSHSA